jgi:hypothetical protein
MVAGTRYLATGPAIAGSSPERAKRESSAASSNDRSSSSRAPATMSGSTWKTPRDSVNTSTAASRHAARAAASTKGQRTDELGDAAVRMAVQHTRDFAMSTDPSSLRTRSCPRSRRFPGPGKGRPAEAPGISSMATMKGPESIARAMLPSKRSLACSSFSVEACANSTIMLELRAFVVRGPERPRRHAFELRFYK